MKIYILTVFAYCCGMMQHCIAQYPANYFISPVHFPLKLSGNYGEVRSNHFHSGIDIKTDSVEGKAVVASASGYVSRIKVSAVGYGKALYLKHNNGYTTVYAHLRAFAPAIEQYIQPRQLEKGKAEIDVDIKESNLYFNKGDTIAYSGNTGGSTGPHLHFEIRNSKTDVTYNPLLFGIGLQDTLAPTISHLAVYRDFRIDQLYKTTKVGQTYTLTDTIEVSPQVKFGFVANDFMNNSSSTLGMYEVKFLIDNQMVWVSQLDSFGFDESINVNGYIDYAYDYYNNKTIERLYLLPNNDLNVLSNATKGYKNNLLPAAFYRGRLELRDFQSNLSVLEFYFTATRIEVKKSKMKGKFSAYTHPYNYLSKEFKFSIKPNSLFQDEYLFYQSLGSNKEFVSAVHGINDASVPLKKSASVSIRIPTKFLNKKSKLVMVKLNKSGSYSSIGGDAEGNYIVANTKTLGAFALMIDTEVPTLISLNNNLISKTEMDTVKFRIKDALAGIGTYTLTVNEQKVIACYDAKNNLLYVESKYFTLGENLVEVTVADKVKNANSQLFRISVK